jgi:hypothetical protein
LRKGTEHQKVHGSTGNRWGTSLAFAIKQRRWRGSQAFSEQTSPTTMCHAWHERTLCSLQHAQLSERVKHRVVIGKVFNCEVIILQGIDNKMQDSHHDNH